MAHITPLLEGSRAGLHQEPCAGDIPRGDDVACSTPEVGAMGPGIPKAAFLVPPQTCSGLAPSQNPTVTQANLELTL